MERLRADINGAVEANKKQQVRIDAALAEAEWLTHIVSIGQERLIVAAMVMALRGDK